MNEVGDFLQEVQNNDGSKNLGFIKMMMQNKKALFRGISTSERMGVRQRRTNRHPRDTMPIFDHYLNLGLKEKGVIPRSQGIFCTTAVDYADEYGSSEGGVTAMVFPKGKFNMYYISGVPDLTTEFGLDTFFPVLRTRNWSFAGEEFVEEFLADMLHKTRSTREFKKVYFEWLWEKFKSGEQFGHNYGRSYNEGLSEEGIKEEELKFKKLDHALKGIVKNRFPKGREEVVLDVNEYYFIDANLLEGTYFGDFV